MTKKKILQADCFSFTADCFTEGLRSDEKNLSILMIDSFSTWEPFDLVLRKQLNLVGRLLQEWLKADHAFHFFTNPQINKGEVHWFSIVSPAQAPKAFTFLVGSSIFYDDKNIRLLKDQPEDYELMKLCQQISPSGELFLLVPFDKHDVPFGNYCLAFKKHNPNPEQLKKINGTLNVLQGVLKSLLYNQYPISKDTYLPSFLMPHPNTASAILFCDIRNSTAMFEIARMTEQKYADVVVALLQRFLEYASLIISVQNIGRIHKFMGDGFMATFGEYLIVDNKAGDRHPIATCAIGLLTAKLLVDGFDEFWKVVKEHRLMRNFLETYNEDLDMKLGVGLNYGTVSLQSFGIATAYENNKSVRGFYEFTAIGDHVNFAQRLCSLANKPVSLCDMSYRSKEMTIDRDLSGHTAPIVVSKTVAYRMNPWLEKRDGKDALTSYRSDFHAKGKGHAMPAFEVKATDIRIDDILNNLDGMKIHEGRYHDALKSEFALISERVLRTGNLDKVKERLRTELDQIDEKYKK